MKQESSSSQSSFVSRHQTREPVADKFERMSQSSTFGTSAVTRTTKSSGEMTTTTTTTKTTAAEVSAAIGVRQSGKTMQENNDDYNNNNDEFWKPLAKGRCREESATAAAAASIQSAWANPIQSLVAIGSGSHDRNDDSLSDAGSDATTATTTSFEPGGIRPSTMGRGFGRGRGLTRF